MLARRKDTQFGDQQGEQHLQRRDLLRAGQPRIGDRLRQVEIEQQRKEQEQAGELARDPDGTALGS